MNELKLLIGVEFQNPSEGFVKLFAKQIHRGMLTAKVVEQFAVLTRKSIQQFINDLITERLKSALKKENDAEQTATDIETPVITPDAKGTLVETTDEEKEGYMIVKTILRQKIKPARIAFRDAQSYFAILLDDNNRKTICRLYLNGSKKYIGTLDDQKKETKSEILTVDDIFLFSDVLCKTVEWYDMEKVPMATS